MTHVHIQGGKFGQTHTERMPSEDRDRKEDDHVKTEIKVLLPQARAATGSWKRQERILF